MIEKFNYIFKIIIIGDCKVGKSCLQLRFTQDIFKYNHDVTIGVEFGNKIINLDNEDIKLQIWDTAGQESFRSITKNYYRKTSGCLIVYDISSRESFLGLKKWLDDFKSQNYDYTPIVLVGNKNDLTIQRSVSYQEGELFAEQNNLYFFECSCKNNYTFECS